MVCKHHESLLMVHKKNYVSLSMEINNWQLLAERAEEKNGEWPEWAFLIRKDLGMNSLCRRHHIILTVKSDLKLFVK